ncbi:aspartic peptidase domain-containing protein [Ampelomyces quisqualis]|uniref:Aspartic peptidase domain-containing protein n=1 Tax=Ampelomyces quisqualis TaxID=50730 RepID=A0A6A5QUV1_AMPQU|nr:aspartic peptidase domain-containing protein [Ampelomyces quisqualis]
MQLIYFVLLTICSDPIAVADGQQAPARNHAHLARRRNEALRKRQNLPLAPTEEDLTGIGGRIYMTNITVGGQHFALVIDTGSSDTWVATTEFQCVDPNTGGTVATQQCRFGPLYNRASSATYKSINYAFSVDYAGGEFLDGDMGTETFGIGGVSRGQSPYATVTQTIGAVNQGYWAGDGVSSGLMGLAYPALAAGVNSQALNYTSVMYTFLALRRSTIVQPRAGGLLAIGGIPNISTDNRWVQAPVQPVVQGLYAYYSIKIEGFDISPPTPSSTTTTAIPKPPSSANSYGSSKQNVIIDSGTTLNYFPDNVAAYIGSLFIPPARYEPNYNTYLVSCTASAPRVAVKISGQSYFMAQDDLMNRGPGGVGGAGAGAKTGECVLAVQNAQGGSLVLGDAWLKNVLVVFDVKNATDVGRAGSDKNRDGAGSVWIVGREVYT